MYQALYRKWRPKTFDEVDGQEHITDILKKQVLLNRLSHAYLFTGTRGTGKTTCAKLLARAVNCENPVGGNPCGKCGACIGIENGSILDVTEMDAASNNGVENVRALREEAVYSPVAVKRRVYIIDEVHMLSNSAFNALLKILEEPPEHLIFILATTELHKVPPTILSRCQRYSFRRITPEVICNRISKVASAENMELTPDAAMLLSRLADGSFRDALSLLDQCAGEVIDRARVISAIGIAENDEICEMLSSVLRGDAIDAVSRLNLMYQGGKDVASVLGQLASLHRDILLLKIAPKNGSGLMSGSFSDALLRELSGQADSGRLLAGLNEIQETSARMSKSSDRKLAAELCLLKLSGLRAEYTTVKTETVQQPAALKADKPYRKSEKIEEAEEVQVTDAEDKNELKKDTILPPVICEPYTGYTWKELLSDLKGKLAESDLNIISDPLNATAEISDGSIRILAENDFALGFLNDPQIENAIKETAKKRMGAAVKIQIELRND